MSTQSTMQRLRAANPARSQHLENDVLLEQILSTPGDPRVLERGRRSPSRAPRRRLALIAPALTVVAAVLLAAIVPQTRADIRDALRAVLHGGSLPGRTVPVAERPGWMKQLRFADGGEPRVIAEAGGERMLVYRQQSGTLCFDLGGHVGICGFSEEDLFAEHPVALLGPTAPGQDGRFRLWGLALASVKRVEVVFADAPAIRMPVDGAFGIGLTPTSRPQELVAYGEGGRRLASLDLTERWEHRPAL